MAGVGGIACTFVKGAARGLKDRITLWQSPGRTGYGAHVTARGDAEFHFRAINYHNPGAVEAWARDIEALQGTVVSIVDDWGFTHINCLITRVGPPRMTAAERFNPVPSFNGARGDVTVEGVIIA